MNEELEPLAGIDCRVSLTKGLLTIAGLVLLLSAWRIIK